MTERADLSAHDRSSVLRPGIRTYKPRRTRMSEREIRALDTQAHFVLTAGTARIDFATEFGVGMPVVLEIGFGSGAATAAMAAADPATGILAVDVHTPGVGDLLWHVGHHGLTNVRVIEADALAVMDFMIVEQGLAGVRSFFPDPWPKARHHKRRLVQPEVLALVASRLVPGGWWHLATDWQEYASSIVDCFDSAPGWRGGVVPRPNWRPQTRFEGRALREGRTITDHFYRTSTA